MKSWRKRQLERQVRGESLFREAATRVGLSHATSQTNGDQKKVRGSKEFLLLKKLMKIAKKFIQVVNMVIHI